MSVQEAIESLGCNQVSDSSRGSKRTREGVQISTLEAEEDADAEEACRPAILNILSPFNTIRQISILNVVLQGVEQRLLPPPPPNPVEEGMPSESSKCQGHSELLDELEQLVFRFTSGNCFNEGSNSLCAMIVRHQMKHLAPNMLPIFPTPGGLFIFLISPNSCNPTSPHGCLLIVF